MKKNTTKKTTSSGRATLLIAGLAAAGIAAGYFLHGPNAKKNRKKIQSWSVIAKAEVLKRLSQAKDVSEEKYHALVAEALKRFEKKPEIKADEIEKLKTELGRYWKQIRSELVPTTASTRPKRTRRSREAKPRV